MPTNVFLSSLPAILGLTGFIVFWLLRHNTRGDVTTRHILDKVRRESPEVARHFEGLKGKQLEKVILNDQALKHVLSRKEGDLLRQALKNQFILSLVVYLLCAALFCFGIVMFLRQLSLPTKFQVSDINLESDYSLAHGKAVDLDDLVMSWQSQGTPEDVTMYLENVQTGRRSTDLRTNSAQQRLVFPRDTFRPCLTEREPGRSNRVRVICQGREVVFRSREFEVLVGVNIWGFYDQERRAVRLAAMIDHALVQGYRFEAKAMVWTKGPDAHPVTFGGNVRGQADFVVDEPDKIRWDTLEIVYIGPDDPSIVRATTEPI
jgi:hypothetical protein